MLAFAPIAASASNPQDTAFLKAASQDNADLRILSHMGANVHDASVRQFAQSVFDSTGEANKNLTPFLTQQRIAQAGSGSLRASDQYDRIDSQSGVGGEEELLTDIAIDARIAEDDFATEAQSGGDPALRHLAATYAKTLTRIAAQADALDRTIQKT